MKKSQILIATILAVGTLFWGACVQANKYYAVSVPATANNESCALIELNRITAPLYLDQQQIAYRTENNTIKYSDKNRWAEPLVRTLKRQLPERISVLLKHKALKEFSSINLAVAQLDGELNGVVKVSASITLNNLKTAKTSVPAQVFFIEKSVPVAQNNGNDAFANYSNAVSAAIEMLAQSIAIIIEE